MDTDHEKDMMSLEDFYLVVKERQSEASDKELLLDVRTPEEFAEGHIEGSMNISHTDIMENMDKLKGFEKIYIYCRAGRRSQVAYHFLKNEGFNNLICINDAGMKVWAENGYPLVK